MNKSKKIFSLCMILGCIGLCAQEPDTAKKETKIKKVHIPKNTINSVEYAVSNTRITKINSVVKAKYDKHEDLESAVVRAAIEQEISRSMPLVPTILPDQRSVTEIRNKQMPLVNAKFNQDVAVYRKAMLEEFNKKYPLYKKRDKVTIYYQRGSTTYRVSGFYYGFGVGGNTIRINSKNIPVIDLLPQDRIHFDAQFHKEKAEAYADAKVKQYTRQKNEYAQKLFNEEIKKQRKINEQRGYILQNGVWVSPKAILEAQMKIMIEQQKIRAEKEAKEKAELGKNKPAEQNPEKSAEKKDAESEEEDEEE